jgi:DNA-binding FadR family transcriptional regulator
MGQEVKPRTVRDTVVVGLLRDVVAGRIAAGDRLTEQRLAARFGHSRGMVREALKLLEEHGVVEIGHGVGSHVCPEEQWDLLRPELLAALIDVGQAPRLLAECIEVSRAAATAAAELAAERVTAAGLERIRGALAALADAEDPLAADAAFHAAIVAAAANRVLARTLRSVRLAVRLAGDAVGLAARADELVACDRAVCEAVSRRDGAAARAAMTRYLDLLAAAD